MHSIHLIEPTSIQLVETKMKIEEEKDSDLSLMSTIKHHPAADMFLYPYVICK